MKSYKLVSLNCEFTPYMGYVYGWYAMVF